MLLLSLTHCGGGEPRVQSFKNSLCPPPPGGQVRYRREHASGRHLPFFPLLEDLMRDVCDGAALLTVVHSYCPDHIKLEGRFSFDTFSQTSAIFGCDAGVTQSAAPLTL